MVHLKSRRSKSTESNLLEKIKENVLVFESLNGGMFVINRDAFHVKLMKSKKAPPKAHSTHGVPTAGLTSFVLKGGKGDALNTASPVVMIRTKVKISNDMNKI